MSIKGVANKGKFHAHAIVGTGTGSCKAQKGNRYIDLANKSGGKVASICKSSFANDLKDIGSVAFGLSHQFFLKMNATKGTIKVTVGGKPCLGGANTWTYDEPSNSVIFMSKSKGGTCMPKKGDKVTIYYKVLCFP